MPRRADINVAESVPVTWAGNGSVYIVQTPAGVLYVIYVDTLSDVSFKKSTDGGLTWGRAVPVHAGTASALAVWYDRWSGIDAGLIHVVMTDSADDDTSYRTIDTESADALSTETDIFLGGTTAIGGHLSVTRAVGGNVYCKTVIDAGVEGGFFRLPAANVPNGAWDAARTVDEAMATLDQMILLPDFDAADTQDIMAIFWDSSADEISRKLYDDSGNAWAEASIATGMVESTTAQHPNIAVAADIANTRHVLVAWSGVDTVNADLRCWTVDAATITEVTNVVLNSTDDQGLAAISIDLQTGYWHVFYGGKSDGSETWNTAVNVYTKVSQDSGSTWGAETRVNVDGVSKVASLFTCPRLYLGPTVVAWYIDALQPDELRISVDVTEPRATYVAGLV